MRSRLRSRSLALALSSALALVSLRFAAGITFADADTNGDGCVSADEFKLVVPALIRELRLSGNVTLAAAVTGPASAAQWASRPRIEEQPQPEPAGGGLSDSGTDEPFALQDGRREVREQRRHLAGEVHEGVPTNISAATAEIQVQWDSDFGILKRVLADRGYDVSSARHLCELPAVFCDTGYRRRTPAYASTLMRDWVGREYQLIMPVVNTSRPALLDPALFDLQCVGYFHVVVTSGPMPPGAERLSKLSVFWVTGDAVNGLEGPLPAGFWSMRTRILLLADMGLAFTGKLETDLPFCRHLDYRLYLYRMPAFQGNVSHLSACKNLTDTVSVWGVPKMTGNVWSAILAWGRPATSMYFADAAFSGRVPFAEPVAAGAPDPWRQWCEADADGLPFRLIVLQDVEGGRLPSGLSACARKLVDFSVGPGFTGPFALNFSKSLSMKPAGIVLRGNKFSGGIPDIPPQTTSVDLRGNRWTGDISWSWYSASGLTTLDLSDCDMKGPIPNIPPSVQVVNLARNRLSGPVPGSWRSASLAGIDLTNNLIVGPPFTWGRIARDPHTNLYETIADVYEASPSWPLESLKLRDNPLGINAGFLVNMGAYYRLRDLDVSNCSLHGHVSSENLKPHVPSASGGVIQLSGPAYTGLTSLDLSHNGILTFGFNDDQGMPNMCWAQAWSTSLPALQDLSVKGCKMLRKLHPRAFALAKTDARATPALLLPSVHNRSACGEVFGMAAPDCAGAVQAACLYVNPLYTLTGLGRECADLGAVVASGMQPAILVDPALAAPGVLCRCLPGFEARGDECLPCGPGTYRSSELVCMPCPSSSNHSLTKATSVMDCQCTAGHFMSYGVCERCPESTFSSIVGATSIKACTHCPPGTVTDSTGADSADQCVCPVGSTLGVVGEGTCTPCMLGKYKARAGDDECDACQMTDSGVRLSTRATGTETSSGCLCPAGSYVPIGVQGRARVPEGVATSCVPCPQGIACDSVNTREAAIPSAGGADELPFPEAAPGHMTKAEAPMTPYKCRVLPWCPGGRPATCALGRDPSSVACGSCPDGTYSDSSGTCRQCHLATVLVTTSVVLLVLFVGVVVWARGAGEENGRPLPTSLMTIAILAALTVTSAQTLGVLANLSVTWVEPVKSVLSAFAAVAFDVDGLRSRCFLGPSPAAAFALRLLLAPVAALLVFVVFIGMHRTRGNGGHGLAAACNAVGNVVQLGFVSVLTSATLPFLCYSHPGRAGASMLSEPSLICFSSREHIIICAIAVISFLVVIVPFLTVVAFANYHHKGRIRSGDRKFLVAFNFLFSRYKPEAHYFGSLLLLRSCLVCCAPVVARESAPFQVILITTSILGIQAVQLFVRPWRSTAGNVADGILSSCLILLMLCVSISTDFVGAKTAIGVLAVCLIVAIFASALLVFGFVVYRRLFPRPWFQHFLSHHKAAAAGQARYLQLVLEDKSGQKCFLDSDHLRHLDDLLIVVEGQVGRLIVYLTGDTLRRPWCAAEIAMAFLSHKRAAVVRTESFAQPPLGDIQEATVATYVQSSDMNLVEYGLSFGHISAAFLWLLSASVPSTSFDSSLVGVRRFDELVRALCALPVPTSGALRYAAVPMSWNTRSSASSMMGLMSSTRTPVATLAPDMLLISSEHGSHEAAACAGILAHILQHSIATLPKNGVGILANLTSDGEILDAVAAAHAVLVILSYGSLHCEQQRKVLASAGNSAVPICTPQFQFPDGGFYASIGGTPDGAALAKVLQGFFKRIALPFTTHGSSLVLKTQCLDVMDSVAKLSAGRPSLSKTLSRVSKPVEPSPPSQEIEKEIADSKQRLKAAKDAALLKKHDEIVGKKNSRVGEAKEEAAEAAEKGDASPSAGCIDDQGVPEDEVQTGCSELWA